MKTLSFEELDLSKIYLIYEGKKFIGASTFAGLAKIMNISNKELKEKMQNKKIEFKTSY